jgi:hypothetical protein
LTFGVLTTLAAALVVILAAAAPLGRVERGGHGASSPAT